MLKLARCSRLGETAAAAGYVSDGWTDMRTVQMAGWLAGWLAGWMDGWKDGQKDGRTDGLMDEGTERWMNGKIDEWMGRRMN